MAVPENYKLFKFKNGEDVIAEYIEHPEDKNHLVLHRPMQIQVMMAMDKNRNPVPAKLIMTESSRPRIGRSLSIRTRQRRSRAWA